MQKLNRRVAFRCKPEERAELKRVSRSLDIAEADVARAAFREGLRYISDRGIKPQEEVRK